MFLKHAGKELSKEKNNVTTIVITHLNPDIVDTLAKVLTVVKRPADGITLVVSNPAKQVRPLQHPVTKKTTCTRIFSLILLP